MKFEEHFKVKGHIDSIKLKYYPSDKHINIRVYRSNGKQERLWYGDNFTYTTNNSIIFKDFPFFAGDKIWISYEHNGTEANDNFEVLQEREKNRLDVLFG